MTNTEREQALRALIPVDACVTLVDVRDCNWRPHPVMIGAEHVALAADRHGGMLTTEVIDAKNCAWRGESGNHGPRCGLKSADHHCDTIAIMALTRNAKNPDVLAVLLILKDAAEASGVDGFAFVKNSYEFIKDEAEQDRSDA